MLLLLINSSGPKGQPMLFLKRLILSGLFLIPSIGFAGGVCQTGTLTTTYNSFTGKQDYVCTGYSGGGGVGVYNATASAGFPVGFSASTANFTGNINVTTINGSIYPGNPFDQNLNTIDSPNFQHVETFGLGNPLNGYPWAETYLSGDVQIGDVESNFSYPVEIDLLGNVVVSGNETIGTGSSRVIMTADGSVIYRSNILVNTPGFLQVAHFALIYGVNASSFGTVGNTILENLTTEAQAQVPYHTGGTMSGMIAVILANSLTKGCTVQMRINGVNANEVLHIPAGTNGEIQDTTHSDVIRMGDLVDYHVTTDSGTGQIEFLEVAEVFAADTNNMMKMCAGGQPYAQSTNGYATYYEPVSGWLGSGTNFASQTESINWYQMKTTGTFSNMGIYVAVNGRTGNTVLRFRHNGANGNMNITIPAGATGLFEDNIYSDYVVVGDTVAYSLQMDGGAGSGHFTASFVDSEFTTQTNTMEYLSQVQGHAFTPSQTTFNTIQGGGGFDSAEVNDIETLAQVPGTFSHMHTYVQTNTLNVASTINFRKNFANGNEVITIPAGKTGYFEDTTHTDVIVSTDQIDYKLTTPAGTGQAPFNYIGIVVLNSTTSFVPLVQTTIDSLGVTFNDGTVMTSTSGFSGGGGSSIYPATGTGAGFPYPVQFGPPPGSYVYETVYSTETNDGFFARDYMNHDISLTNFLGVSSAYNINISTGFGNLSTFVLDNQGNMGFSNNVNGTGFFYYGAGEFDITGNELFLYPNLGSLGRSTITAVSRVDGHNYNLGFPSSIGDNTNFVLPTAGSAGQVLTNMGTGVSSWTTPSSGGGGGYAVQPATVTFQLNNGVTVSSAAIFNSTATFYGLVKSTQIGNKGLNFSSGTITNLTVTNVNGSAYPPAAGNPFDQSLNTSDSVQFNGITTDNIYNSVDGLNSLNYFIGGPNNVGVLALGDFTGYYGGNTLTIDYYAGTQINGPFVLNWVPDPTRPDISFINYNYNYSNAMIASSYGGSQFNYEINPDGPYGAVAPGGNAIGVYSWIAGVRADGWYGDPPGSFFMHDDVNNWTASWLDYNGGSPRIEFLANTLDATTVSYSSFSSVNIKSVVSISSGASVSISTHTSGIMGIGTLSSGSAVISTNKIHTGDFVFLTDTGGSIVNLGALQVQSISNLVSFTVKSSNALDTSTFNWLIIRASP